MLMESIFDLFFAIYSIVIVIVYGIMYKRRRILFSWFILAINNAFASTLFYFRYIDESYRIVSNIFYFLGVILLTYVVLSEYYETFIKTEKNQIKAQGVSKNFIFFAAFSLTLLNIILSLLFLLALIVTVMMGRIYVRKKSITHGFLFLALISGSSTTFFAILSNIGFDNTSELSYIAKLGYLSFLLATGLAAPIEDRINKSENQYKDAFNRAEFYKDLFAHDISNILQNVQSSMDLFPFYLEKPNEVKESYNLINLVKNQVNRGATLISNIRKLSEIEDLEILLERTSVTEVLKNAIEYLNKTYEDKEIKIQINSAADKYVVKANELLFNVFENILVNSVKYNNNPNIEIIIKISRTQINNKNFIKIEFIDNGIGIPDNIKDKVFQRAFIKDKTVSGMGLGLSLVNKIIEKYNGQIWVEDKIKGDFMKGSNFIIIIPEV